MFIKLSVWIKCFTLWNCKWKFNLFKGQISNIFSLTNAECRSYMILLCTFWMVFWFGNVPKIGVRKLIICLLLLRRFDGRVNLLPHFPESTMGQNLFEVEFVIFQIILSNFNCNILFSNLMELIIRLLLFQRFDERVNLLPHLPESTVGPKKN